MGHDDYGFTVRPLSEDEGGGWLVEYPDLPGCVSDGETIDAKPYPAGAYRERTTLMGEIRREGVDL